jgi:hypothetical protein
MCDGSDDTPANSSVAFQNYPACDAGSQPTQTQSPIAGSGNPKLHHLLLCDFRHSL